MWRHSPGESFTKYRYIHVSWVWKGHIRWIILSTLGCETISTINKYHWDGDNYLSFKRFSTPSSCLIENCNPIEFKIKNSQECSWNTRKTWGIMLYITGKDPGTLLTIQIKTYSPHQRPSGPLMELALPIPVCPALTKSL